MKRKNFTIQVISLKNPCSACLIVGGAVNEMLDKLKKDHENIKVERLVLEDLRQVHSVKGLEVEKFPAVIINGEQITAGSIPSKKYLLSMLAEK